MKRYSEYKVSGVEWIGEIPSHWEISKLKFNTDKDFMYGANESGEDMQENQPRYIRITDINEDGRLKNDTYVTLDYEKAKPYILEDKDILFARSGATVGKTFLYNKSECNLACFAGYLIKFTANRNKCNPEYIYYYTQSKPYEEFININISQATIQNVSAEKYKNLYNPLPPLTEQEDIIKYLDKKTSQIETLISKKEELIKTLKASKTKLISETVTKGLDKDVPMKDSGVEWIGEIPKHWNVCKLKHLLKSKITDGPHETPMWVEEGVPFLSAEAIVNSEISMNNMRGYITESQYEEYSKKSKVYKNDILFCKSGSTTGKSALVKTDDVFGIWSPLAIIRANENKLHYVNLFYFIQSEYFTRQVVNYWTFGTQPNIGMGSIENLYIAYSKNIDEQVEIVKFLDKKTIEIDRLISKVQEQIELLKKAKQKLITEVVTGKIDVTNL